jgi:hypothetical protein
MTDLVFQEYRRRKAGDRRKELQIVMDRELMQ